jgi:hypothetical protein
MPADMFAKSARAKQLEEMAWVLMLAAKQRECPWDLA